MPPCPNRGYFGENWGTVLLLHLLCFVMLKHFEKVLAADYDMIMIIGPKLPVCTKREYLGVRLTNVTFVHLMYFAMLKRFKKIRTVDWDIRLYNWAQFGQKEIFWENWVMLHFSKKCFKSLYSLSWGIRLHNFGPNWSRIGHLSQKDIFLEKINCYFCVPIVLCRAKRLKGIYTPEYEI